MGHKSISDLKSITREQLLGNYSRLSSYVILYMLVSFTLMTLIGQVRLRGIAVELLLSLIYGFLIDIFTVGFIRVCRITIHGGTPVIKDFFYVLYHDPDKIIIISSISFLFTELVYLPFEVPSSVAAVIGLSGGVFFFLRCVLFACLIVVYVFAKILLSQCYYIYLDRPECGALEILRISVTVMMKHKLRYFYLMFNVFGMSLLGVLTLGIGMIWIMPLNHVLMINFYEDLKGCSQTEYMV
ncbi:MAG: DUF975 family protein [Lachnospiraceae bacterium]|nr:DUF975 family protein [Lachnospiraceae bacterium]